MDQLSGYKVRTGTHGSAFSEMDSDHETMVLDSCNSTWYFQPSRMRFRRTLKGSDIPGVTTQWQPYFGLQFERTFGGFVILLNAPGTRLLRSWCHRPGHDVCDNCEGGTGRKTKEVSLDEIRQLALHR